ncbi:CvpA family protein [Dethiothermospora halolimnae]|uniref:CvpA family protein n=1 Tax=Dethiothermospora halolimnae TaxID=3114390 RepID=UPI003CCB9BF2
MNIIDVVMIVIILLNGLEGLKKGFILSVMDILGFVIAGYIAKIYYISFSRFIVNNTNIYNKLNTFIMDKVSKVLHRGNGGSTLDSAIEAFEFPNILEKHIINQHINNKAINITESISNSLTNIIINIISIIIVFFIAKMIINIVANIINGIFKLPVLKSINNLLGLLTGAIKGLLIIYILFALITPIIVTSPDGWLSNRVYTSIIGQYFYENNIIILFLEANGLINIFEGQYLKVASESLANL